MTTLEDRLPAIVLPSQINEPYDLLMVLVERTGGNRKVLANRNGVLADLQPAINAGTASYVLGEGTSQYRVAIIKVEPAKATPEPRTFRGYTW